MRRAALLTAVVLLPILSVAQTRRPPTFQAGVEVVRLNVSVSDARREFVTGLSDTDFAVFEDGVRQPLSVFSRDEVPISLVLLMDCSASIADNMPLAKAAANRFVETLRRVDLAQVVQFNERVTILQDFTADHGLLESAVERLRPAGATGLYNALYIVLKQLRGAPDGRTVRRRAVVLLSDGEDTTSVITDEQVLELARRTEIAVYAVSLRVDRPQDRDRLSWNEAAHFLTTLVRDSGGEVHFPRAASQLEAVYGRIATELRTQYTLGYVSQNSRRDGRWRRIVVQTPGRQDLQVRHKVGYYAPSG